MNVKQILAAMFRYAQANERGIETEGLLDDIKTNDLIEVAKQEGYTELVKYFELEKEVLDCCF